MTPDLPPGIGPHEGRELELMLAGVKPLAKFADVVGSEALWPEDDFAPHVAAGRIVMQEYFSCSADGRHDIRHLYYALPGEVWRIAKVHALDLKSYDGGWNDEAVADSMETGRLLGYSEDEVRRFADWVRKGR